MNIAAASYICRIFCVCYFWYLVTLTINSLVTFKMSALINTCQPFLPAWSADPLSRPVSSTISDGPRRGKNITQNLLCSSWVCVYIHTVSFLHSARVSLHSPFFFPLEGCLPNITIIIINQPKQTNKPLEVYTLHSFLYISSICIFYIQLRFVWTWTILLFTCHAPTAQQKPLRLLVKFLTSDAVQQGEVVRPRRARWTRTDVRNKTHGGGGDTEGCVLKV